MVSGKGTMVTVAFVVVLLVAAVVEVVCGGCVDVVCGGCVGVVCGGLDGVAGVPGVDVVVFVFSRTGTIKMCGCL